VRALDHGDDVYFANYVNIGKDASAYDIEGRIRIAEHACLDASRAIHRYGGDMVDQIVRGNLIFASTLVYRRDRYPDLEFRDDFVYAGEDYLFFLDLATRGASFVFSMQVGARLGEGVNIYAGSGCGTDTHFARLYYEMKYRQACLALYPLDGAQRRYVAIKMNELRVAAARDLLHRMRHGKRLDWRRLRELLVLDKAYPVRLPGLLLRALWRSPTNVS
jgi:succinoglycan biosynthesis protein ExoW